MTACNHYGKKTLIPSRTKVTACTVAGREEERPLRDPGSELRKGGSWRSRAHTTDIVENRLKNGARSCIAPSALSSYAGD